MNFVLVKLLETIIFAIISFPQTIYKAGLQQLGNSVSELAHLKDVKLTSTLFDFILRIYSTDFAVVI